MSVVHSPDDALFLFNCPTPQQIAFLYYDLTALILLRVVFQTFRALLIFKLVIDSLVLEIDNRRNLKRAEIFVVIVIDVNIQRNVF